MKTKKCTGICGQVKLLSEFYERKDNSIDGYRNQCKKCQGKGKFKENLLEGYKRCSNPECDKVKLLSEFYKRKCNTIDGYYTMCKKCMSIYINQWQKNNPEIGRKACRKYTQNHRDELNKKRRERYWKDPEMNRKAAREYAQSHREEINKKNKERSREDKNKINKRKREIYHENIEKHRKYQNDRNKNIPHINAWRKLITHTFDKFGTKKEDHTIDLLKYSSLDLKNHITSLFTEKMSWEKTYGKLENGDYGWSIDHIIGTNNFKSDTPAHIVNELDNLQPLWMTNKIIDGVFYDGNFNKCDKILIEDEKSRYLYRKYRKYLKDGVIEEYDKKLLLIEETE